MSKVLVGILTAALTTTGVLGTVYRLGAADRPALSALEQLRVENVNLLEEWRKAMLEADTCRGLLAQPRSAAQQQLVREKAAALKADIERSHPGYTWDPQTGTFTRSAP